MVSSIALHLDMEALTDTVAPRMHIHEVTWEAVELGAEAVILGYAGTALHPTAA